MIKTYLVVTTRDMPTASLELVSDGKRPIFIKEFNSVSEARKYDEKVTQEIPVELGFLIDDFLLSDAPSLASYNVVDSYRDVISYEMELFKKAIKSKEEKAGEVDLHNHELKPGDIIYASNSKININDALNNSNVDSFILYQKNGQKGYFLGTEGFLTMIQKLKDRESGISEEESVRNIIANYKYDADTISEVIDILSRNYKYVVYSFRESEEDNNETDRKTN